jgi:hypothetical protein
MVLLLQASLADFRVPDYVAEDPLIKVMGVTRDQVVTALQGVGFTDDLLVSHVKARCRGGLRTSHMKDLELRTSASCHPAHNQE